MVFIVTALLHEAFKGLCAAHARAGIMLPIAGGQRSLHGRYDARYESAARGVHLRMAKGRLVPPRRLTTSLAAPIFALKRVSAFTASLAAYPARDVVHLSQELGVRSSE